MFIRLPITVLRRLLISSGFTYRRVLYRSSCITQSKAAHSTTNEPKSPPPVSFSGSPPKIPHPIESLPVHSPTEPPTLSEPNHSKVWTIPNILTFTRIGATPFIGYFIGAGHVKYALILFVYSCLTDLVDGYVARRFNMQSQIGSIIDPFADKFLMATCTVALAYTHTMPIWIAGLIFGRDFMLSMVSFYHRYKCLSSPVTVKKFFDIAGTPTHTVHPSTLGKANTALQMLYIAGLVTKPALEALTGVSFLTEVFQWLGGIVSVTTVTSGLGYLTGKNFKKIVKSQH